MYGSSVKSTETILQQPASLLQPGKFSPYGASGIPQNPLIPVMIPQLNGGFSNRLPTFSPTSNDKKIANYLLNLPNYDLLYLKDINGDASLNPGLGDGFEEVSQAVFHD